jgi:hypothetical protein
MKPTESALVKAQAHYGTIGGKTTTHTLESSHSPFLSQPAALSKILIDICVQSLAEETAEAQ